MEKYIRYKRFSEPHNDISIQEFYNRLIEEGWDIIYYNEIIHPRGALTNSPQDNMFHVIVVAGKRQENTLPGIL